MFLGGFWHLSQLKFEEISQKLQKNADFKKHAPPPIYLPPWESKLFWEVSHLSQLIFEEISPKMPRMQILTKLGQQLPDHAPLPSQKVKIFFGGFWHLSKLKFEEISPKIPRMQISRKLSPLLPPLYSPPWPPWSPLGSKKILGGFWHLFMSNPSHLAQKIRQNHQLWSNRCMTPFVAALCSGGTPGN